jgi:serine/threonine protein kinase
VLFIENYNKLLNYLIFIFKKNLIFKFNNFINKNMNMNTNMMYYKPFVINNKYLCTGKVIGSGSFSDVCIGEDLDTKKKVAIKIINNKYTNGSQKYMVQLKRELEIVQKLNHKNITKCLYVSKELKLNRWCLVMEYCNGGTLESYIKNKSSSGRLSEYVSQHLIKQLCNGLEYLKEFGIIHRDLKPDNLLVHYDTVFDPVRINFFLCLFLTGSKMYMAPEIFLGKPYTYKADLWSVGVILYRMLTGKPLFSKMPRSFDVFKPESNIYNPNLFMKSGKYSNNCIDLLAKTLVNDPNKRITWDSFVNHPFFTVRIMTDPEYKLELTEKELRQLKSISTPDSLYIDAAITPFGSHQNAESINIDKIKEPLTKTVCDDYRLVLSVLKLGDKRLASGKFIEAKIIYKECLDVLRKVIKDATQIIDKKPKLKTQLLRKIYKDIFETCTIYVDRIKSISVTISTSNIIGNNKISTIIIKYVNYCCKKTEIMILFDDTQNKLNNKINLCLNCLDFLDKFIEKRSESDILRKLLYSRKK